MDDERVRYLQTITHDELLRASGNGEITWEDKYFLKWGHRPSKEIIAQHEAMKDKDTD